jgi:carbonic anhydrase
MKTENIIIVGHIGCAAQGKTALLKMGYEKV